MADQALTITPEISGQAANPVTTYCYLYEPLRMSFRDNKAGAAKLYIDLEIYQTEDSTTLVDSIADYAVFDLNEQGRVSVDLMKLAQQYHDANVYRFAEVANFDNDTAGDGWHAVVSQYRYTFKVTSNVTSTPLTISKIPIIGGRTFQDFEPSVLETNKLTEADVLGLDLTGRWFNYPQIDCSLATPTDQDATPTIDVTFATQGTEPCGGMLVWKSRLGGWMYWGFDLRKESQSKSYTGEIPVGLFESDGLMGKPYVETNYTGISTSYKLTLKSLSLTSDELRAVQSITASPAIYYIADSDGGVVRNQNIRIELMKLDSATAPLDNRANGGDFTVSLSSISRSSHNVR